MLKTILVFFIIIYLGLYTASKKETEWISWFLAVMAIVALNIFYSIFLKHWPCCCFAYQPEFPQRKLN
jgi:hypothetical protein